MPEGKKSETEKEEKESDTPTSNPNSLFNSTSAEEIQSNSTNKKYTAFTWNESPQKINVHFGDFPLSSSNKKQNSETARDSEKLVMGTREFSQMLENGMMYSYKLQIHQDGTRSVLVKKSGEWTPITVNYGIPKSNEIREHFFARIENEFKQMKTIQNS